MPTGRDVTESKPGSWESFALWTATGLGVGKLRPAPGTLGSAAGLATFVLFLAPLHPAFQVAAGLALTVVGCWASHHAARLLDDTDPSAVVVDEWAAMWLSAVGFADATGWLVAFFLFRFFDIVKPPPARQLDRMSRRRPWLGIMADDLVAALYTQAVARAILLWIR